MTSNLIRPRFQLHISQISNNFALYVLITVSNFIIATQLITYHFSYRDKSFLFSGTTPTSLKLGCGTSVVYYTPEIQIKIGKITIMFKKDTFLKSHPLTSVFTTQEKHTPTQNPNKIAFDIKFLCMFLFLFCCCFFCTFDMRKFSRGNLCRKLLSLALYA